MEYDERMGIAYDTIFYGVLYFNFDKFKDKFSKSYGIGDENYNHFLELRKTVPLPLELYPFFYCDLFQPSFLNNCLYNDFDFGQEDFPAFWKRFLKNPSSILRAIFQYYTDCPIQPDLFKAENSLLLIQRILALDLDQNLTLQLVNLIANFEETLQTLSHCLTNVYISIKKLFASESETIHHLLTIFQSEIFLSQLNIIHSFSYTKISKDDRISISFLNFIVVLQKGNIETGYKFVIGRRCQEYLDVHLNYYKIQPRELCEALGNPIKSSILQLLNESEFTVTQLSDKLVFSRQTVNRHMLWLLNFNFIKIARKSHSDIFYQLNREFFTTAQSILQRFVAQFEPEHKTDTKTDKGENK